jgi:uncharacterized membrane protein
VVLQPITGLLLARSIGWSLKDGWLLVSIGLYSLTGLFWLPVVWMQIKMRDLAHTAAETGRDLPAQYHQRFRRWFACGIPAFLAVLTIIWLMLAKPVVW